MKVRCFRDTDTLLIDFAETDIVETAEINESVMVELDADGGRGEHDHRTRQFRPEHRGL